MYNNVYTVLMGAFCMLLNVGDVVKMRKAHPCGGDTWVIVRTGADVKIKCQGCGRVVMLERGEFEKRLKKIVAPAGGERMPE